ncbi:MAG: hypothetical protein U0798_16915 [Gemmataceae bacterium]
MAAASAGDYVILKDGTITQGRLFKERSTVTDSLGKTMVHVDKLNGLQGIDDGPKTIFRLHRSPDWRNRDGQVISPGRQAVRTVHSRCWLSAHAGGTSSYPAWSSTRIGRRSFA